MESSSHYLGQWNWYRKVNIYLYILYPTMRKVRVEKGKLVLTDDVTCFFQKTVTPFGNGAKIDCPKEFLGRTVYVVVVEE